MDNETPNEDTPFSCDVGSLVEYNPPEEPIKEIVPITPIKVTPYRNNLPALISERSLNKPTAYVVGIDHAVERVFREHNFSLSGIMEEADLVIFTGGADINPELYNQERHRTTFPDYQRDQEELEAYNKISKKSIKVGICRGAQLLNVLSGGSMFQHVSGHAGGRHRIQDLDTGFVSEVNSVHHQMMNPGPRAKIIAVANCSIFRATDKNIFEMLDESKRTLQENTYEPWTDSELLWYPDTSSFCFQGHPEYGHRETTSYFFDTLRDAMDNHDLGLHLPFVDGTPGSFEDDDIDSIFDNSPVSTSMVH